MVVRELITALGFQVNQKQIDRGLGSIQKAQNQALEMAKGIVGANLFQSAVVGIINFAQEGLQLASDLTEVQNVVDTTFGQGARIVNQWARDAAEAFGISELQAKKFNGTLGAMMKSSGVSADKLVEMSTAMSGLAGDFASFYNLQPEEAFDKIRAGISGETEPLKQIGINMSVANLEAYALTQGITKQYQKMTQAEQVMLRYNYLLSVSKDAQGDFAKTLETSAANQKRVADMQKKAFAANLMSALLPAQIDLYKNLNSVLEWLIKNTDAVSAVLKTLAYVVAFVAGVWLIYKGVVLAVIAIQAVQSFIGWIKYLQMMWPLILSVTGATNAWGVAQAILNMIMMANPIGLVVAAIILLIGYVVVVIKYWNDFGAALTLLLGPIGIIINVFKQIYDQWDKIKAAFQNEGILAGIKAIGSAILDGILFPVKQLLGLLDQGWQKVKAFFGFGGEGSGSSSIDSTAGEKNLPVPAMATRTNYVPKNMFAMLHKGEAVVPAKYNNNQSGGVNNDITVNVQLAVPAGTADNQTAYIKKVAKQAFEESWQSLSRQAAVENARR